jgi:hypothetical protein
MPRGSVRAYVGERAALGLRDRDRTKRRARSQFRAAFRTPLLQDDDVNSISLDQLAWGTDVELPSGLSDGELTPVLVDGQNGFVRSAHLIELAYVKRRGTSDSRLKATLTYESSGHTRKVELIWGDSVQIIRRGATTCEVRARAYFGAMKSSDLTNRPLLEAYFIDVGQGDGVLVRTPDGKHLLIDGGLERSKQLTGKNAADFVDWKFFYDYGDHRVRLNAMMASHSDNDHYGGLHDLVKDTAAADRELDCLGVDIALHASPWREAAARMPWDRALPVPATLRRTVWIGRGSRRSARLWSSRCERPARLGCRPASRNRREAPRAGAPGRLADGRDRHPSELPSRVGLSKCASWSPKVIAQT